MKIIGRYTMYMGVHIYIYIDSYMLKVRQSKNDDIISFFEV